MAVAESIHVYVPRNAVIAKPDTSNLVDLNKYFCHWRPAQGATMVDYDIARYPSLRGINSGRRGASGYLWGCPQDCH
ncbi:hypothetical protein EXT51_02655 [Pectobacterium carotovorum subsp. carotovorum]|nr:hypothetical protein [Pectobacterium carotovorum subsp. carotovorum]